MHYYCIFIAGLNRSRKYKYLLLPLQSKDKSTVHVLTHGDNLLVGATELLLHIHPALDTCDGCEPGQIQALQQSPLHCGEDNSKCMVFYKFKHLRTTATLESRNVNKHCPQINITPMMWRLFE